MKISIDTKEDSHEEIRKAIKMLQHITGDSDEVFTNQPAADETGSNPFTNIFGDTSSDSNNQLPESASNSEQAPSDIAADLPPAPEQASEASPQASDSTEDLFAELFSEEDLKKMDNVKAEEDEEEEIVAKNPKSRKNDIEFY
jgi:hypothetical protein